MPPAAGSATAARTSSTDSSDSRTAIRRTTLTAQGYLAASSGVTMAAARPADDGRGADHGDRRPGGGRRDRGLLARDPAAGQGVPALALIEQDAQHLLVAEPGAPAGLAERGAVHHPGVDHVPQVYGRRPGHPDAVQPLRGPERQPGRQLDALQPTAKSPSIRPATVNSSAETRSSMWQNCQRGAQPFTVSRRGASKCLVTSVSTAYGSTPTRGAGRTTVTAMPGLARGDRRASCSISSRSPATLLSVSGVSGASSGSGTGLSGRAP